MTKEIEKLELAILSDVFRYRRVVSLRRAEKMLAEKIAFSRRVKQEPKNASALCRLARRRSFNYRLTNF